MKVNTKILSIPPYISTSWKNVLSLHIEARLEGPVLMIGLANGSVIEIPNLDPSLIESVFAAHERHLGQEPPLADRLDPSLPESFPSGGSATLNLPINFGLDLNMGNVLQHNPAAADSPDLPEEVTEKISQLSKIVGFDQFDNFPKPEPHCNCMHCQIMRVMRSEEPLEDRGEAEEEVSDDDLKFREWDIVQLGEQLYQVSNPFNRDEQFNVHLGSPVGCTCGKADCEHVRAVLNS